MDKRKIAKFVAKTLVIWVSNNAIEKTLAKTVPSSQKLHANELAGAIGSFLIADALEPTTDKFVDDIFNQYEAAHNHN